MAQLVCPRCGARDSFMKGYLPETCVCRICQSQLGWTEIPGCGPDCKAVEPEPAPDPTPNYVASTGVLSAPDALARGNDDAGAAGEDPPAPGRGNEER